MSEILSDNIHVSRKRRRCDQCGCFIEPGDRYRKQVHTFDGFCTYVAHEDCDQAANKLREYSGEWRDWWEGGPVLADDAMDEDREWIALEFPVVAARLGWAWP